MKWLSFLFLLICFNLLGQNVSLHFDKEPVKQVFGEITKQTGLVFSYSSFDDLQRVTIHLDNSPVSVAIQNLEKSCGADMKLKGKYVIVKSKIIQEIQYMLSGAIIDYEDGSPIAEASVYEKSLKVLVNSDPSGQFSLKVKPAKKGLNLHFAKEHYQDTTVFIQVGKGQELHILMKKVRNNEEAIPLISADEINIELEKAVPPPIDISLETSVRNHEPAKAIWQNILAKNPNIKNITDSISSAVAISFVPPISTNKLLAPNTRNLVSLNILAGITAGVDIVEIGGLLNLDKGDVRFFQAAGLSNMVWGNVYGLQAAGLYNSNTKDMGGIQASGLFNYVGNKTVGAQLSGLANYSKSSFGLQAAGLANLTSSTSTGAQVSGLFNYSGKNSGLQLAGLVNIADKVVGAQISGVINYADTLTGVQIGLINISKHGNYAVPIGLINFIGNGYHKLELSYEDTGFSNLSFRTGTRWFQTSFIGGTTWASSDRLITYGLGAGTNIKISKKLFVDIEAQLKNVQKLNGLLSEGALHGQLFAGLQFQAFKSVGLRFGPTLNLAHLRFADNPQDIAPDFIPSHAQTMAFGGRDYYQWLGWKAAITLF